MIRTLRFLVGGWMFFLVAGTSLGQLISITEDYKSEARASGSARDSGLLEQTFNTRKPMSIDSTGDDAIARDLRAVGSVSARAEASQKIEKDGHRNSRRIKFTGKATAEVDIFSNNGSPERYAGSVGSIDADMKFFADPGPQLLDKYWEVKARFTLSRMVRFDGAGATFHITGRELRSVTGDSFELGYDDPRNQLTVDFRDLVLLRGDELFNLAIDASVGLFRGAYVDEESQGTRGISEAEVWVELKPTHRFTWPLNGGYSNGTESWQSQGAGSVTTGSVNGNQHATLTAGSEVSLFQDIETPPAFFGLSLESMFAQPQGVLTVKLGGVVLAELNSAGRVGSFKMDLIKVSDNQLFGLDNARLELIFNSPSAGDSVSIDNVDILFAIPELR